MKKIYTCESIRMSRYLYSLGFNKKSRFINDKEVWDFDYSELLQEALDFYYFVRRSNHKK